VPATSLAVAQTSPTLPQATPQPSAPRVSAAETPALAHVAPAEPASAVAAHVAPPEVPRPIPATSHAPPDATIDEATPEPSHLPSKTPPGARPALAFAGLIKAVLDLAPYLAFLHDAREVSFADGLLVLGLPSELSVARAKEQRPRLLSILQDVLGQPIGLELVHDAQAAHDASARMSLAETEAKLAQTERNRRQREAQDHPALKTVREVFPDVLWMEPEIDEINAEELPHVQSI
jgi:hypothetical protein